MSTTDSDVDYYFSQLKQWRPELEKLRTIALGCGLVEQYKWRQPCYTSGGKNVVILGEFKDSCTISFFKGALLKDPAGVLTKPSENTQAARVIRFTALNEVKKLAPTINGYLHEAIENERAGLKLEPVGDAQLELPAELLDRFVADPKLHAAFDSLTPGRQRAYAMHFAAAKQSKTRTARIDKFAPRILDGKGLNDCVCGLTNKPPGCDGSHNAKK